MTSLKNFKAAFALAPVICLAICLAVLLAASTSHATIQISTTSGASRADAVTPNMSIYRIWGGTAGCSSTTNTTGVSCNGNGLTNTCTGQTFGDTFAGCNEKAINNDTLLTITFRSSTLSGYPIAFINSTSNTTTTTGEAGINTNTTNGNAVAAGSLVTVQIPWSAICSNATSGTTDCSSLTNGATVQFFVGISTTNGTMTGSESFPVTAYIYSSIAPFYYADDPNCNTGSSANFCYFEVFPGDQKVTVQNVSSTGTISNFSALRFYYKEATVQNTQDNRSGTLLSDFGSITPDDGSADLQLDPLGSGGFVGNGRLTGLQNDIIYVFKMAHLDLANNLGLVTSDYSYPGAGVTPTAGTQTYVADTNCDSGTISGNTVGSATCHVAEPGAVEGILSKEFNCFIATASYGSPFEAKVQTFRDFRNRFLLNNFLGRKFVHFYYSGFGPKAADFIRGNESLRAMSRAALFPLWFFAKLSLELGFVGALLATLGFLALIALTARKCSQHLRMDA